MKIFSYSLTRVSHLQTLKALTNPPTASNVAGLVHAECAYCMTLGAPILSPSRYSVGHLAMFAAWDSEEALEDFFSKDSLGHVLGRGWHVRMKFLRRWGEFGPFKDLPLTADEVGSADPVVAVTIARMKILEVPRFIHWGRPVEQLVRDAPGTTLALATMRPPTTVSTFTIWKTQQAMLDMVQGHSHMDRPNRHLKAMIERDRRDFHHEFTTLRFAPLSEHGEWEGKRNLTSKLVDGEGLEPPTTSV